MFWRLASCQAFVWTLAISASLALEGSGSVEAAGMNAESRESGPFCGLYCVYAALNAVGQNVSFEAINRPRYLGSPDGSTIHELKRAVDECGAYSIALSGLGAESLRLAKSPMILHVATDGQLRRYNHWVLFCGMEGGHARILDAPNPVELVKLSDVLARWNGTALVVSRDASLDPPVGGSVSLTHVVLAICVVLTFSLGATRVSSMLSSRRLLAAFGQSLFIIASAAILAIGVHAVDDTGFLRNPGSVRYVAAANIVRFFPKVDLVGAQRFVRDREGVVVDARFPDSFGQGTIPGAINVPIDTLASERARRMIKIDTRTPLLVFCQSSGCDYDETLAKLLAGDGFEDIRIFPGGYQEWIADEHTDAN